MYTLIAAADSELGIGKNNTLPWDFKEDMQFFHNQTTQELQGKINILIMGGLHNLFLNYAQIRKLK